MIKRIDLDKSKLNPNFIGSWLIEPTLCDSLISYFDENQHKHKPGMVGKGLNLEVKNRSDICINPLDINLPGNELFKTYFNNLFECYKDYNLQWSFLGKIIKNNALEIGSFNLGKYEPGQHFKETHCERMGLSSLHRILAFMTYLNDVKEGGSTYFNHYDLDIQPRKGLSLIWPAEWTHSHKGNILKAGSKYIITGWLTLSK